MSETDIRRRVDEVLRQAASSVAETFDGIQPGPDPLRLFLPEARESLANAERYALDLEIDPRDRHAANALFRAFHALREQAGFLGLDEVRSLSRASETLLNHVRRRELLLSPDRVDLLCDVLGALERLVDEASKPAPAATSGTAKRDLTGRVRDAVAGTHGNAGATGTRFDVPRDWKLGEILVDWGVATPAQVEEALRTQAETGTPARVGEMLVRRILLRRSELEEALAEQKNTGAKLGEVLVEMGAVRWTDVEECLREQQASPETSSLGALLVGTRMSGLKPVAHALRAQARARGREPRLLTPVWEDLGHDTEPEEHSGDVFEATVVLVGDEHFVIPTDAVVCTLRPKEEHVHSLGRKTLSQSPPLPLCRLDRLFEVEGGVQDPRDAFVVVVEDEGRRAGLMTDGVLSQQPAILRTEGSPDARTPGIMGIASLEDGAEALVVHVGDVIRKAHAEVEEKAG